MCFHPVNFQLATPFRIRLRVRRRTHWQTDRWERQTTAIKALCPHSMAGWRRDITRYYRCTMSLFTAHKGHQKIVKVLQQILGRSGSPIPNDVVVANLWLKGHVTQHTWKPNMAAAEHYYSLMPFLTVNQVSNSSEDKSICNTVALCLRP